MSALREEEARDGARFETFGGLELPDRFGDAMTECEAVRRGAGLFDLSFRARIRVVGDDRVEFLHNLLSADVAGLATGSGRYAAMLTEQSKVVTDLDLLVAEDAVFLDLDARLLERARAHLERYLVADDVELEDLRAEETTIGVHGRTAAATLAAIVTEPLPEAPLEHRPARIGDVDVRLLRRSWTGEPGFDLSVPRDLAGRCWRALRDAAPDLVPIGMFAFNVLRLEAGVPWAGVDFDESTLALEAGLEPAISFGKGCYLGQETIERQTARGKVNRRRVGLRFEGTRAPRAGSAVRLGGEEVGRLTSAAFSPTLQAPIAMAILKRAAAASGAAVDVEVAGETVRAVVVEPPFVALRT